jgi:8-oxo-dGTP pyrophosphatase MutT (NUDIX family)
VYDVLRALGVLGADTDTVASPVGYYFIQSVIALMDDSTQAGHDLSAGWQANINSVCGGLGARLVHALEAYRMRCVPSPTPLRKVSAVMAVITAQHDGQPVFLMQYDDKANQFQPLGGKREAFDRDSEAALLRELSEELEWPPLTPGEHLSLRPLSENRTEQQVSATLQVITQYDHSFYLVTDLRLVPATDHDTRWLTLAEVQACQTQDGRSVTTLLRDILADQSGPLPYSLKDEV